MTADAGLGGGCCVGSLFVRSITVGAVVGARGAGNAIPVVVDAGAVVDAGTGFVAEASAGDGVQNAPEGGSGID